MTGSAEPLGAVVLAGGRSRRLGQDKATAVLDGERLVDRVVAAVARVQVAGCVVVGPASLEPGVPVVRESPAFGGPVAGLAAGIGELVRLTDPPPAAVLVLPCDLRDPDRAVAALLAAWPPAAGIDGVHLTDARSQPQWLTAIYRRDSLRRALDAVPDLAGASMRTTIAALRCTPVPAGSAADDIDTPTDLAPNRPGRSSP